MVVDMSLHAGPFALRLYVDGEGSGSLLCDFGDLYRCPQWHYSTEKRMTWLTPEDALKYLTSVAHVQWPEFREEDVRVVRVIPPTRETYVEVMCFGHPEPTSTESKGNGR